MLKSFLLALVLLPTLAYSQIKVDGFVKSKNDTLVGVVVQFTNTIDNSLYSAITNNLGYYEITVPQSKYLVKASYIGYKLELKEILINEKTQLNLELIEQAQTLGAVEVRGIAKRETINSVIVAVKNNTSVADGISSETIKKTPDRTVSDALKRVSGVTIQNDKFVLVRGLADRYNLVQINKTPLPSTEPDRRAFSFDIIPTSLIDNLIIIKSAAANLPGDFSGGLIQITTKEAGENFISGGISLGAGTLTTFNNFRQIGYVNFPKQFPSTYKFRISDISDRKYFTSLINNPTGFSKMALPNSTFNLAGGYTKGKLNSILSATYREAYSVTSAERREYFSSTDFAYEYRDNSYTKTNTLNALFNLAYLGKTRLNFKNIFNRGIESSYLTRNGQNFDNIQEINSTLSNHIIKTILNSQFDLKKDNLDFALGYNLMLRDQPDYRVQPLAKSLGTQDQMLPVWRDTYRFWSVMDENSVNGSINYSFDKIKIGASYLTKMRNFKARTFRYDNFDLLNEITNNTDRYGAQFDLASGYIMFDHTINKFKINSGIRTEYNWFTVATSDFGGAPLLVKRNYLDVLPSINLSYSLTDKNKLRLSANQTLARPEFREVANFSYYDFVRGAQIIGNPNLEKSKISNLDIKFERYPRSGENISVGIFAKHFNKPIELVVDAGSVPSNLLITYSNPASAIVTGIELDLRKKLTEWLGVYSNISGIFSQVTDRGVARPLQGQSPYIINAGATINKGDFSSSITYNRIGKRISAVGFQGYPDIYENARDVLDIVLIKKIKLGEIKLSIADVFSQDSRFFQHNRSADLISIKNEKNISISLNLKI